MAIGSIGPGGGLSRAELVELLKELGQAASKGKPGAAAPTKTADSVHLSPRHHGRHHGRSHAS